MPDQQNTFFRIDLRPAKQGMHAALTAYEAGEVTYVDVLELIRINADTIPDLTTDNFIHYVSKLLLAHNTNRAHKLVNALGDFTIRPTVRVSILLTFCGLILGILATLVWLIAGIGR